MNRFRKAVEALLTKLYYSRQMDRWYTVHLFYEARYLNPDSPERNRLFDD